jgi:hypothetical protein
VLSSSLVGYRGGLLCRRGGPQRASGCPGHARTAEPELSNASRRAAEPYAALRASCDPNEISWATRRALTGGRFSLGGMPDYLHI